MCSCLCSWRWTAGSGSVVASARPPFYLVQARARVRGKVKQLLAKWSATCPPLLRSPTSFRHQSTEGQRLVQIQIRRNHWSISKFTVDIYWISPCASPEPILPFSFAPEPRNSLSSSPPATERRRGSFVVARPLRKVLRRGERRWSFALLSCNSCALSFSLDASRIAGTTSLSSERPPDGTTSVASSFGYLPESRNVSTMLPVSPRTSLACSFALYRTLVAGPWSAMVVARHSRGRDGREGVEHVWVMAIASRSRGGAVAHLRVGWNPAGDGRSRGRAAVCEGEGADGWDLPVSDLQREGRGAARAASARAELEWAGLRAEFRPLTAVLFFFLSM
jgi:hypothetical protein